MCVCVCSCSAFVCHLPFHHHTGWSLTKLNAESAHKPTARARLNLSEQWECTEHCRTSFSTKDFRSNYFTLANFIFILLPPICAVTACSFLVCRSPGRQLAFKISEKVVERKRIYARDARAIFPLFRFFFFYSDIPIYRCRELFVDVCVLRVRLNPRACAHKQTKYLQKLFAYLTFCFKF